MTCTWPSVNTELAVWSNRGHRLVIDHHFFGGCLPLATLPSASFLSPFFFFFYSFSYSPSLFFSVSVRLTVSVCLSVTPSLLLSLSLSLSLSLLQLDLFHFFFFLFSVCLSISLSIRPCAFTRKAFKSNFWRQGISCTASILCLLLLSLSLPLSVSLFLSASLSVTPSVSLYVCLSVSLCSSFSLSLLSLLCMSVYTTSIAKWLRRPPRERKVRGSNPACDRIFPGRVIPVTQTIGTLPGAWR